MKELVAKLLKNSVQTAVVSIHKIILDTAAFCL